MVKPSLIIFDCDGVVIDSEVLAHRVLVEALSECGITLTLEEALERYSGLSEKSEEADIQKRYNVTLPPNYFVRKKSSREQIFERDLRQMPGLVNCLNAWPGQKCIASGSSLERLEHSLKLVGLWDRFAPFIFSAVQVERGKPAPDLFLFASHHMNVKPQDCLVIEDSVAGVQAARAAGMQVYGFTGGAHCPHGHDETLQHAGAERIFSHLDDLAIALTS